MPVKPKLIRSLCVGLCALCFILFSAGCTSGRGMIEASSTKVEIQSGKNKGMAITLPKELDTSDLHLKINPKTGEITLDAAKLKSSSQGIIESAGVAQAQAMQAMSATLNTALSALLPMLARAASGIDIPAAPAPEPAPAPALPQQRNPEPAERAAPPPAAPVLTPIAPIEIPLLGVR